LVPKKILKSSILISSKSSIVSILLVARGRVFSNLVFSRSEAAALDASDVICSSLSPHISEKLPCVVNNEILLLLKSL